MVGGSGPATRSPGCHARPWRLLALLYTGGIGHTGGRRSGQPGATADSRPLCRRPHSLRTDYCLEIEGAGRAESRRILEHLERHATQDELTCRFRWEPDSIAVWDNRCTMHKVLSDDLGARFGGNGFKRVMRRATIRC